MIRSMVKVCLLGVMAPSIKAHISMANSMVKGPKYGVKESGRATFISESGIWESYMAKESIKGQMEKITWVNSKMKKSMGMELKLGQVALNMMVNIKMERNMGKGYTHGLMARDMRVSGKQVICMAKVPNIMRKDCLRKEYGIMVGR